MEAEATAVADVVWAYKDSAKVEGAFRVPKPSDSRVRPVRHGRQERIGAQAFLCLLADHVEWHLRQGLAPLLLA